MNKEQWQPIDQMPLEKQFEPDLLIAAPELIDADFNLQGVSSGFWDGELNSWIGIGWDSCNDLPTLVKCNPTHFMWVRGPYTLDDGGVAICE